MLRLVLFWIPSVLCGIHVVRTGASLIWLWFMLIAPLLGPAIYFCAVMVPELMNSRGARNMQAGARQALDPNRDLREAQRALADLPSVENRIRVAQAAAKLGGYAEAEAQWRICAQGLFAEDSAVLMGHAVALIELGRHGEALERLEKLHALNGGSVEAGVTLAFARAYEGLGRMTEAEASYRAAGEQTAGLEANARYVNFLVNAGRRDEALRIQQDIERRFAGIAPSLRADARGWRDLAARVLKSA